MNITLRGQFTPSDPEGWIVFCTELLVDGEPLPHHGFKIVCEDGHSFLGLQVRVSEETFDEFMDEHSIDDVMEGTGIPHMDEEHTVDANGNTVGDEKPRITSLHWSPAHDELWLPISSLDLQVTSGVSA